MFVFRKIIASYSFRSFFNTRIFYRFVFKAAIPEEIHANQELFTESLAIFREERYGGGGGRGRAFILNLWGSPSILIAAVFFNIKKLRISKTQRKKP